MDEKIDTARILGESFTVLRANVATALLAMLTLVGLATATDTTAPDNPGLNFAIGVLAVFAQYGVTRGALRAAGLRAGPGSGASFVGAAILSGMGIALGFVLLVLPGIYLWARWSLVSPLIVGEGMRTGEALSTSWARTRSRVVPISAALLTVTIPPLAAGIVVLAFAPDNGPAPLFSALVTNLCVYGWQLLVWHCAVAIHGLTQEPSDALERVFA